jgi:hypothetical protein
MQYRPDIVISDRSGVPAAIVQVKALTDATAQIATRYVRNLLSHGVVPSARYVLLITPDIGYLWASPEAVLRGTAPSLTFPVAPITRSYLPSDDGVQSVGELVLESIVEQWLFDLADGVVVDDQVTSSLREAGFLDAVRDGQITVHTSV